jgi:RNA polymerase sigma factor
MRVTLPETNQYPIPVNAGLVQKVELAKVDKRILNALVLEYIPFIKKNISTVLHNGEARRDALTDAMLAFVHAVMTYKQEAGTFVSYAATVIRNRLINAAKKERLFQKRFFLFSMIENETQEWEQGVSERFYDFAEEQRNIDMERDEVDAVFARYGFDWNTLAKKCPKQERSRRACFVIARKIMRIPSLYNPVINTCQLPLAELVTKYGFSKKHLEKYRQYIIALIILLKGDYPYIRAILPQFFDTEDICGEVLI